MDPGLLEEELPLRVLTSKSASLLQPWFDRTKTEQRLSVGFLPQVLLCVYWFEALVFCRVSPIGLSGSSNEKMRFSAALLASAVVLQAIHKGSLNDFSAKLGVFGFQ